MTRIGPKLALTRCKCSSCRARNSWTSSMTTLNTDALSSSDPTWDEHIGRKFSRRTDTDGLSRRRSKKRRLSTRSWDWNIRIAYLTSSMSNMSLKKTSLTMQTWSQREVRAPYSGPADNHNSKNREKSLKQERRLIEKDTNSQSDLTTKNSTQCPLKTSASTSLEATLSRRRLKTWCNQDKHRMKLKWLPKTKEWKCSLPYSSSLSPQAKSSIAQLSSGKHRWGSTTDGWAT